ncbi:MAG: glycosyltransferase family 4 protein [Planctomycetaceae bacterium]|jgi:glycosyltransferase involved in cell wall biosynthesis|nr:glycosyltransferase family 4 protein [Planctomycetaceae bacterium]
MKPRLIFDIANFAGQPTFTGIPRFICEVLKRIVETDRFDIVTICSLLEEESALRNFRCNFSYQLPFQSKDVENYVLENKSYSTEKSQLKIFEETLHAWFPDNWFIKFVADTCRKIKWKISPPLSLSEYNYSPFYEKLVKESDLFFSPFNSLIPELIQNPSIKKILVIHDLIPIVLADMYKGKNFFPKKPWDSITPDTIVFTVSESTKRDLLKYCPNVLQEQVTTILLAADQRFVPCLDRNKIETVLNKYSIPVDVPFILSVATLDIRKNFDHVMNSFSKYSLSPNGIKTGCRLVLTGVSGWQDRKFKKTFAHLPKNVKEKIIFTGYVEDDDLPILYSAAACFCYMSIYEGFGLPPLEAMQCGAPVITSDTSSLPEVVGDAGIMLDPHDVESLANAFENIICNENLRKEMIDKGIKQAKNFSWDRCVDIILRRIFETIQ